ncbi:hypothetical protein [Thiocapsa sp.]|uniref:hypothetical protein n=1 Tax=Thiocapsa sp. TaxID=2024551 RepID=UPI0025D37D14|nr:hypothetical protein [Thiocapsa sp.]
MHVLNALLAAPITAVDILKPDHERETLDDKPTVVEAKAHDAADLPDRGVGHRFVQSSWVPRTGRETPEARPGYADFSRPPRGLKSASPGWPDESGVPKRSRAATWTLPMWPRR